MSDETVLDPHPPAGGDGRRGGGDGGGDGGRGPGPRRARRAEIGTAVAFALAFLGALGLTIIYWLGGQAQAEGVMLAVATGGIGAGIVLWAKHFMPSHDTVEERAPLASPPEDVAAFREDFEAGESQIVRRRVLVAIGGGACAMLGVAALFPIRSLGPRPGAGLKRTPYAGGRRVVREDGSPVRPEALAAGSFITVWPEGHTTAADASTLLIHVSPDQEIRPRSGRENWTIDNIIAYSKLCTHAGCPVGLYQATSALLLCPCHQSTFEVLDGAKPVFGPAARSLPQLPLALDADGFIVATGDFSDPVGAGFWDRGR